MIQTTAGTTGNKINAAAEPPPNLSSIFTKPVLEACLSNLSTAYNVLSATLVLKIMGETSSSLPSSSLLFGMMAGQLTFGALAADNHGFGLHLSMNVAMLLQIFGSLASSLAPSSNPIPALSLSRFILGAGCGGVYPIAASLSASSPLGSTATALVFAQQGVGYLSAPLLALLVLSLPSPFPSFRWRFLLAVGALPPGLLLSFRACGKPQTPARSLASQSAAADKPLAPPESLWTAIASEPSVLKKLAGTAGTWFLFDVLFYGNVLFQPVVLLAAFGASETAPLAALHGSILNAVALPGYFLSVALVDRLGPRYIQSQGFLCMAIIYIAIGSFWSQLADRGGLLLLLYGLTFFFSNFGELRERENRNAKEGEARGWIEGRKVAS